MSAPQRHRTNIQVRFADTDALGHLNNASYASYAEVARLDFLSGLDESIRSMILAHLAIDFRRQVNYGESVWVETFVDRVGRSSIGLQHTVYAGDALAAEIRSVVVYFDYAAGESREVPASVRTKLARYQVPRDSVAPTTAIPRGGSEGGGGQG